MFSIYFLETFRSGIVDLFFGVFLHLYSLWTWGVISKEPGMKCMAWHKIAACPKGNKP